MTNGCRFDLTLNDQTTSVSETNITFPIPDEAAAFIQIQTVGRQSDTSNRAIYHREALVYRDAGGSATIQGSVQDVATPVESNASWNATIGVSGNNATIPLTGVAATTIEWRHNVSIECV
jgi:hypothetical protein